MLITQPEALADFVPLDNVLAEHVYYLSKNQEAKADLAHKLFRFYLHQGANGYFAALPWFLKAFENKSAEAYVIAYNATSDTADGKTCIDPLIKDHFLKNDYPCDKKARTHYLTYAITKKHPIACQLGSQALNQAGTAKENTVLLTTLQENGFEISRAQSLEFQAIALIKGDRVITNNYSQLVCQNNPEAAHDNERLTMLKTMGLEICPALGWDLRVLSALGKGQQASNICFNELVKKHQKITATLARIDVPTDERIACTFGNNLRFEPMRYAEALKYFTPEELFHKRYPTEQLHHIHDHAAELLQSRIDPAWCHDLLAPGVFHHKIA